MRIVFMGTPDFAVPTLEALIESRHEIVGVYTQPDRESGRGKKIIYSPVKECALSHNIPVYQPKGLRKESVFEELKSLRADAIVVVAYGVILRKNVLELTRYGCFNVHGSLLPAYRGAAPIQWTILNGEKETGVTVMKMDEGIDTGDILLQEKIGILAEDTGDSLFEKLSRLGGPLLLKALDMAEAGTLQPVKQGESPTAYAVMLDKKMGNLDFNMDARVLERYVRGLNSWPSAYFFMNGKMFKVHKAAVAEGKPEAAPGEIIYVKKNSFSIQCGIDALEILEIQPEGKKKMDTGAFLRGFSLTEGMRTDLQGKDF